MDLSFERLPWTLNFQDFAFKDQIAFGALFLQLPVHIALLAVYQGERLEAFDGRPGFGQVLVAGMSSSFLSTCAGGGMAGTTPAMETVTAGVAVARSLISTAAGAPATVLSVRWWGALRRRRGVPSSRTTITTRGTTRRRSAAHAMLPSPTPAAPSGGINPTTPPQRRRNAGHVLLPFPTPAALNGGMNIFMRQLAPP